MTQDETMMDLLNVLGRLGNNCYNRGQGALDTTIAREIERAEKEIKEIMAKDKAELLEALKRMRLLQFDQYEKGTIGHMVYNSLEQAISNAEKGE